MTDLVRVLLITVLAAAAEAGVLAWAWPLMIPGDRVLTVLVCGAVWLVIAVCCASLVPLRRKDRPTLRGDDR